MSIERVYTYHPSNPQNEQLDERKITIFFFNSVLLFETLNGSNRMCEDSKFDSLSSVIHMFFSSFFLYDNYNAGIGGHYMC